MKGARKEQPSSEGVGPVPLFVSASVNLEQNCAEQPAADTMSRSKEQAHLHTGARQSGVHAAARRGGHVAATWRPRGGYRRGTRA